MFIRSYLRALRQHRAPHISFSLPLPPRRPSRSASTLAVTTDPDAAALLRGLLRANATWDNLTSRCQQVEITHPIVDNLLAELQDPADAKRALLLFHWSSKQRGLHHSTRSYCLAVHALARAGLLADARVLLDSAVASPPDYNASGFAILETLAELAPRAPGVFDLLLASFSRARMLPAALPALRRLGELGISPSLSGYNALLCSAQKAGHLDLAWRILEHMVSRRRYPNQATVEIMVNALRKGGALMNVIRVLDRIRGKRSSPFVVVGTALALRIVEDGRAPEVMVLLTRMLQKNLIFDDVAYSIKVYAFCKMGDVEMAHSSLDELVRRGLDANPFVYTSLIGVNCREGRIRVAYRLLDEMICAGLDPYDDTYNELIVCSCSMDDLQRSVRLYDEMLGRGLLPSLLACNVIVSKLCENGEAKKADGMLTDLLDRGFVADELVYSNLIGGYGRIGCYEEMLKLYYEMLGKGPSPGVASYIALIDGLCLCGKLDKAKEFADIMKEELSVSSEKVDELLMKYK